MFNYIINSPIFIFSIIAIPPAIALDKQNRKVFYFICICLTAGFLSGSAIKEITAINRPYIDSPRILGLTIGIPENYAFPSLHTTLITIFAWAVSTIAPQLSWLGFIIALIMGLSRVYLGVHYYFDIVGGFLLGTFIFWLTYALHQPNEIFSIKANPHVRRKIFHLIYGLTLAFLIHYKMVTIFQLGLITICFAGYVIISRYQKGNKLSKFISYFERSPNPDYLGLGPLFFLISSLTSIMIFKNNIAVAGIINLAIGDSVNALIGYLWYQPNIFNRLTKKKIKPIKRIGPAVAAAAASLIITLYYVNLWQALAGAGVTLLLGFSTPKIGNKEIDDNLLIPTLSSLAMSLI